MHPKTTLLLLVGAAFAANASVLSRERRIVGGDPASEGEAAYSVSLQNEAGEHFCGGVIVSKNTVITTANCANHLNASQIVVKAGSIDLSKASEFKVMRVEVHPDFRQMEKGVPINDLAAIKVIPDFPFADGQIRAAVLPTQGQKSVQGETVTVSGWGETKENGTASSMLMKIKIRIVGLVDCTIAHQNCTTAIPENQICAGSEDNSKDACMLDGGSGLVLEDLVLGLVSWGQGCGRKPGVYTELAPYRSWIDEHKA